VDLLLDATHKAEHRHFWFRGFRRFVRPLLARAVRDVAAPIVLDCGCGTGANLTLLSAFGRAYGCDLAWTGLSHAHGAGWRNVVRASVAALPFPDAAFDLVTSFDVLYCLPPEDERAAASEMYRALRPGGRALVNVPAFEILRGDHSVLSDEVRRYTRQSLGAVLTRAGFTIERMTYTNMSLGPILLPVRAYQRLRGLAPEEKANAEIRVPFRPANALLSAILAIEAMIIRCVNLPFGSSVLALARKPGARRRGGRR